MVSIQIMGPFASSASVCVLRLNHCGSACAERHVWAVWQHLCLGTNHRLLLSWRRAGSWASTFPEVPNGLVQIPGSPGSSQMQLCCLLQPPTALQCQLGWSSDPPTLGRQKCSRALWAPGLVPAEPQVCSAASTASSSLPAPPFPRIGHYNGPKLWLICCRKLLSFGQGDGISHPIRAAGGPWCWPGVICESWAEVDKPGSFFPYLWISSPCFLWFQSPAGIFEAWEGTSIHSVCCICSRAGFTSHFPRPQNNITAFGEQGWELSTSACL